MRQLYKIILAITIVASITACKNDKKKVEAKIDPHAFTITGTIKNVDNGTVYIRFEEKKEWIFDSIPIVNGHFSYQGEIAYPHLALLGLSDNKEDYINFFMENTNMTMHLDPDKKDWFSIENAPLAEEYEAFEAETTEPFNDKMVALYDKFDKAKNKLEKDSIEKEINQIYEKIEKNVSNYIAAHPNSYISANAILDTYGYSPKFPEFQIAYDNLSEPIKKSKIGLQIADMLAAALRTAIGQPAINLSINDTEDNPISLSSLKGKVVLLDFWASWCGPCRAENPEVKRTYAKFKDKGFEIYAVSLDDNKENWKKAIDEDKLPWLHVSDLKFESEAAELYGVEGVPMNYLLDEEGIIIAKDLHGKELFEKLEEVL